MPSRTQAGPQPTSSGERRRFGGSCSYHPPSVTTDAGRNTRSARNPRVVGLEGQSELVVEDSQVAIAAAHDRLRHYAAHLLRDHAHIGLVAAVVAEAVEAESVVETAEQHDVVLERDIGSPPASAAAAESSSSSAAATESAAAAGGKACTAHAAEARLTARGLHARRLAGPRIESRVAPRTAARRRPVRRLPLVGSAARRRSVRRLPLVGSAATIGGSAISAVPLFRLTVSAAIAAALLRLPVSGAIAALRLSISGPIAAGPRVPVATRLEHRLAVAAAEIHAVLRVAARIVAEALRHLRVGVFHAVAVRRIVLPVVADVDVVDPVGVEGIDDEVAVAPIHAVSPPSGPTPDQISGAERKAGRDRAGADVTGPAEVIRGIVGIRPIAIGDGGVVIGHVDGVGVRLRDGDDLPATLLLERDGLLLVRLKLVVRLRLRPQALDRVH